MLTDALRAEWSKLRTTRYVWWISGIVLFVSIGVAWVMAFGASNTFRGLVDQLSMDPAFAEGLAESPEQAVAQMMSLNTEVLASGFLDFGIYLIAVIAIITVTGEYATGLIGSTAMVVPKRSVIAAAKAIVVGVWSMLLAAVSTLAAVAVGWAMLPPELSEQVTVFGSGSLWIYLTAASTALVMTLVGVGLGFLLRSTAGAIVLLIFWVVIVENVTPWIPELGDILAPWRPINALNMFISGEMPPYGVNPPWESPWISLAYVAVWAVILFIAGVLTFRSRDIDAAK